MKQYDAETLTPTPGDSVEACKALIHTARASYREAEDRLAANPELINDMTSGQQKELEAMRALFKEWPSAD